MKIILKIALLSIAAVGLLSCAPPANTNTANANANSNSNAAPKAAAPTADTLMALDTKAFEAWKNKDSKFFEGFIADNFVGFDNKGGRPTRGEVLKMMAEDKCEIKSYSLTEPHVTPASADAAVLTYKATAEGTCNGKALPSPVTAATVFIRSGDTWKAAYHNEVPVIEQSSPAGTEKKNVNTNGNMNTSAPTPEKKGIDTSPGANTSKPAPAGNSAVAANSNSAGSGSGDALTDALMAVEKKGWEAWMQKNAAGLQETTAKDLTFVDVTGKVTKSQAEVIKMWTNDDCKVSKVDVSDGKATMIANNVAILTFKGTAVGTCGTMKLEPLWGTTVAIKEGDVWKAVYIFETPKG